jgi:hypothetical protein
VVDDDEFLSAADPFDEESDVELLSLLLSEPLLLLAELLLSVLLSLLLSVSLFPFWSFPFRA